MVVHLLGAVFQIRDQIGSILRFLQAGENHLRPWNVLLRVQQVVVQRRLVPLDAFVFVRRRVGETLRGAGNATEKAS